MDRLVVGSLSFFMVFYKLFFFWKREGIFIFARECMCIIVCIMHERPGT